jgi:hypothetical protein
MPQKLHEHGRGLEKGEVNVVVVAAAKLLYVDTSPNVDGEIYQHSQAAWYPHC